MHGGVLPHADSAANPANIQQSTLIIRQIDEKTREKLEGTGKQTVKNAYNGA